MKGKKAAGKSECVKVAIRVRPMNKHEKEENSTICVDVDTQNNTVSVSKTDTKTFQFDYVYPMETTQRQIYDEVAFPIVDSIFQGYNGTIFAYGQTGCGKTFTMMGIVDNPDLKGIIPNAFSHIFGFIKTEGESKKFLVRCSFVEIYNEEVRDLLVTKSTKLDIREDPKKGVFVKDLTYVTLKDTQDIQKCLDRGNKNRHVGQTSMNDQSSRSHSLFTVYLEIEENNKIRSGKLNLVDLAGSERVGKTNATGQTFDEGKKINLSLTALGSVIDALSFNRKHIPYKDSKLTRLLADSLGGNTKTVMFANISPASYNYDETVGTLRYASRAKLIKNAPKINEDPKDALLRKYEEEIKALKEQLANGGEGGEKRVKKKKVKKKKENSDNNENNNNNEEEGNEDYEEEFADDNENENNNKGSSNDEEKEKLRQKLAELEKNLLDNKKLENTEMMLSGGTVEERMKENEEENRKFKEYREQQLKLNEEMEEKLKKLEEEKRKEEESLKNDVNKLQAKIKELNTEISDLRIDNSRDRTDYNEGVKAIYRDNQFYREIIRYMLSDTELKKIIDMSKYNEEEEKWDVQSFSLKEKSLALPTMKLGNPGLAGNRYQKRVSNKHVIFQNYDNNEIEENINDENVDENIISKKMSKNISNISKNSIIINSNNLNNVSNNLNNMNNMNALPKPRNINKRISNRRPKDIIPNNTNLKDYEDKMNARINLRISGEKLIVDGKRHSKSHVPALRNSVVNQKFLLNNNNKPNEEELNNINKILMNQKERERFEALANKRNSKKINPLLVSMGNKQLLNKIGNNKYGKIQLSPLGGNNNLNNINNFQNNNLGNMNMPPPLIPNKKYKLAQI